MSFNYSLIVSVAVSSQIEEEERKIRKNTDVVPVLCGNVTVYWRAFLFWLFGDPCSRIWCEKQCTFMHQIKQIITFFSGVDLKCTYTTDFGATPRVEWKFKDLKGYQFFIYFNSMLTGMDKMVAIQCYHCNLAVAFP